MSQSGPRVLVVDDERAIRRFLRGALTAHGYAVSEAATGQEGLNVVMSNRPDLVILDLGLPDLEGVEIVRQLREWSQIPIIILSVREGDSDKVAALDAGADDYLSKPFSVDELMARLRAALRRAIQSSAEPVFTTGELMVNLAQRVVKVGEDEVQLTPIEYDLLKLMVTHAGRVLTHRQIFQQVWGQDLASNIHLLRVNISNLRRKVEPDPTRPRYILTEPGVGYRLRTGN